MNVCCVLSDSGLCDGLITRTKESYRLLCVVVCDLETSRMRSPSPIEGLLGPKRKKDGCVARNGMCLHIARGTITGISTPPEQ